ncbi:MAG: histidine--tRNA ligase [Desulfurococcaceae archaeon]|jgi:histidyl-tRNA synthetase
MSEYNPPRGMRDLLESEAELYEYLFSEFKDTARRHGFEPIITPTVEYFSLFEAKSGEEIKRSMYVFEDKSGRLLALRPEVTASVVRAYLKSMRGRPKPIRLYYTAQCFRYEEPQYARYREFWQGGLEIIGDPDVNADILVAFTASEFLNRIQVKHVYEVGNVATYRVFMSKLGVSEEKQDYILHLIDKGKIDDALIKLEEVVGDKVELFKELISLNDLSKVEEIVNDYKNLLGEQYDFVISEHERLKNFIGVLKELGFEAKYQPRLVRGLAYYTGLIFEYKLSGAEESPSIGGGGRYDGLTSIYGGPYEYSTGLALGIDRIALSMLSKYKPPSTRKIALILVGNAQLTLGYSILRTITKNLDIEVQGFVYKPRSLSRGLEYCNKVGVDLAIIIGEKELKENSVVVKNMKTGEQVKTSVDSVLDQVLLMLS